MPERDKYDEAIARLEKIHAMCLTYANVRDAVSESLIKGMSSADSPARRAALDAEAVGIAISALREKQQREKEAERGD
jgi:hypothetical protein